MTSRATKPNSQTVARTNAMAALAAWQRGEVTPAEALKLLWPVVRDAADHSNLGALLRALGKPTEAAAAYRRAIALDPHFAAAPYNLGNLLCDAGRLDEAEAAYRAALAARPDYAEALQRARHRAATARQAGGRRRGVPRRRPARAALGRAADQSRRRLARPGALRRCAPGVAGGARDRPVACLGARQSRRGVSARRLSHRRGTSDLRRHRAGAERASLDHQPRGRLADAGPPRGDRDLLPRRR